jgi:hypothetical protein
MGIWRDCKNPDHHLHYRPGTDKWVVQFQWNKKRVSQLFDNKQEALEWRDEQLKEMRRPIFKFEQKTYVFEEVESKPVKEKRIHNKRNSFTDQNPVIGPGKIVCFN